MSGPRSDPYHGKSFLNYFFSGKTNKRNEGNNRIGETNRQTEMHSIASSEFPSNIVNQTDTSDELIRPDLSIQVKQTMYQKERGKQECKARNGVRRHMGNEPNNDISNVKDKNGAPYRNNVSRSGNRGTFNQTKHVSANIVAPPFPKHVSANSVHPPFTKHVSANIVHPPFTKHVSANIVHPPFKKHVSANIVHPPFPEIFKEIIEQCGVESDDDNSV